jgi:hypothetical protein
MVEQIKTILNTVKAVTNVDHHSVVKGKAKKSTTHKLRVDPVAGTFTIVPIGPGAAGLSAKWADLEKYYTQIKFISFAINGYDAVKANNVWRKLYQWDMRSLVYFEGTKSIFGAAEPTMPCHHCGLLLPVASIEIDHQKPQKGGEEAAIAKVFRVFGLTIAGPEGAKNQAMAKLIAEKGLQAIYLRMLFDLSVAPAGTQLNRAKAPTGSTWDDRYTLTPLGEILYSVAVNAGQRELLVAHCMNSLLNLAPLCRLCNGSKSNK